MSVKLASGYFSLYGSERRTRIAKKERLARKIRKGNLERGRFPDLKAKTLLGNLKLSLMTLPFFAEFRHWPRPRQDLCDESGNDLAAFIVNSRPGNIPTAWKTHSCEVENTVECNNGANMGRLLHLTTISWLSWKHITRIYNLSIAGNAEN